MSITQAQRRGNSPHKHILTHIHTHVHSFTQCGSVVLAEKLSVGDWFPCESPVHSQKSHHCDLVTQNASTFGIAGQRTTITLEVKVQLE